MPTAKEVLNGFLSKTLNMDEAGVASLYNEDGEELKPEAEAMLLQMDADRVTSLKPDTTKIFNDGHKKGTSEAMAKFEKELSAEYGLKSDKKGIELIKDLVAQYAIDHPDDPEKIKKSRIYLDAVEQARKDAAQEAVKYKEELETYRKNVEREKLFGNVSEKALVIFEGLKPVLPQDAAKANNLKKVFIGELNSLNYEERDGNIVLLNPDGTDKLDNHGNRIKFDVFVKETAEKYFEFQVSDPKSTPPHDPKKKNSSTVFIINSEKDFMDAMKTVSPEDKPALLAAYNKWQSGGK